MTRFGLDYGGYVPPATLRARGIAFVCRYLREIGAQEVHDLHAAGIDLVLIHEYSGTTPRDGRAGGLADGRLANEQADRLGVPDSTVIYYTADFDASPAEQAPINAYIEATNAFKRPGGLYGGFWPLHRAFNAGVLRWGWQTYAWSGFVPSLGVPKGAIRSPETGGYFDPRCSLYQYSNNLSLAGVSVDFDHAYPLNFGQWPAKPLPKPVPPPAPKPPVPPAPAPPAGADFSEGFQIGFDRGFNAGWDARK